MKPIELSDNNEILLKTTLSKGQVAKFNSLSKELVVKNGAAYLSIMQLHGALLTRSKETAKSIVQAYRNILRIYLVTADELEVQSEHDFIRPIGVQILLDRLATDRPLRASEYRASSALLTYIVAAHPQLAVDSSIEAKKVASFKDGVIKKLKSEHQVCQLTGQAFGKEHEKHVHHIVAEAINPGLAADKNNLIVITGSVHDEYHAWVNTIPGAEISRATMRNFARQKGYSLDWDKNATVRVA
ncbi:HNH endonuclease [Nodosilinea sp. FACHB-131]|uniref:HNH endonuclease n=1 Tax=Cyanophyceae TaxID=3028117 RepID=UPI00168A1F31|nr:HNH endonuclease [Nodosilinea sp. FACHB-131]MBD1871868.1 HNH endonuclease [Nodosilinea sp. FACHB-131]